MGGPAARDIGYWLLARETGNRKGPEGLAEAVENACRKLSRQVAILVTANGARSLIERALVLAQSEFPILAPVQAGPSIDDCLSGLSDAVSGAEVLQIRDGFAALLGNVVGLIDTFIGDDLTLRMVRQEWPDASPDEFGSLRRKV